MPATVNLPIYRGDDFSEPIPFTVKATGAPVDLSGYTSWLAQARTGPDAADVAFTFDVDDTDAATGILVLSLGATVTATLDPKVSLLYDVQGTGTAGVKTWLRGRVTVEPDVSRPGG